MTTRTICVCVCVCVEYIVTEKHLRCQRLKVADLHVAGCFFFIFNVNMLTCRFEACRIFSALKEKKTVWLIPNVTKNENQDAFRFLSKTKEFMFLVLQQCTVTTLNRSINEKPFQNVTGTGATPV